MKKPNIAPKIVTTPADFARTVDTLLAQQVVAVDTESNSLFAYREQVCLIQFSTKDKDYLVDPLALDDISALGEVFANPNIEKIFHAAEYDLLVLKRDFNFSFENLFDTMVAARILGRKRVGLGSLLEDEFNVKLQKKYQRANWGKRPLPPEMLKYATLDTHYLIKLRNLLHQELKSSGRWPLAEEDFRRLCQVNGTPPEPHGVDVWRISGVRDLTPQQVSILYHVAAYREDRAKAMNRPLFKVIGDKTLVAIAENSPETMEELGHLPGMTSGQVRRHGRGLLQAVWEGIQAPPTHRPKVQHPDNGILILQDALRNWRKFTARKMGVESDVVLPRDVMEKIAHIQPESPKALSDLMKDLPWRRDKFGSQIYSVIAENSP
ncbi:MAG TPA: HRDC domain-containing protein [Anaerolineales bacterium]|nr:HRDC domain-containing protein [Anaerolineales bacterium]